MPLILIPMAINVMTGFMLWQSEMTLTAKILITVLIVIKYVSFFYAALMAELDISRNIGLIISAVINVGLAMYSILLSEWFVLTGIAINLILLVIWSSAAVFSFREKDGNEQ